MADEKLTAATRIEKLLDNIAGGDNDVTPATRLEKFLSYIADAMEGGGSGGESGGSGVTLYGPYFIEGNCSCSGGNYGSFNQNINLYNENETSLDPEQLAEVNCILINRIKFQAPNGLLLREIDINNTSVGRVYNPTNETLTGSLAVSFYTDEELNWEP